MTVRPKFKLSRLREIGWRDWDPIGLDGLEDRPDDEYDSYLLQAVGRLRHGATDEDVADYLATIEAEYMGLGDSPDARRRAKRAVRGLREYLGELRG
jgi:hypothetical protein